MSSIVMYSCPVSELQRGFLHAMTCLQLHHWLLLKARTMWPWWFFAVSSLRPRKLAASLAASSAKAGWSKHWDRCPRISGERSNHNHGRISALNKSRDPWMKQSARAGKQWRAMQSHVEFYHDATTMATKPRPVARPARLLGKSLNQLITKLYCRTPSISWPRPCQKKAPNGES